MIKVDKCSEYGKGGELTGADKEHVEVSILTLHLLQSALVHLNTALVQIVLSEPEWAQRMTADDRRALTPLFWTHINLYGKFDLDMTTRLDLGPLLAAVADPLEAHRPTRSFQRKNNDPDRGWL
jgi:hypothetical protein